MRTIRASGLAGTLVMMVLFSLYTAGCGGYKSPSSTMMGGGTATISELAPSSATAGTPGFTLTVNGSGFGTDAVVYWNGVIHSTMYVTGNQLTTAISAADIATKGMVPVYVRTKGQNSNTVNFTVN